MTDSNHAPNQTPSSSPPDYEGSDPDLPDRKKKGSRTGVSTVQVGASAAAAVTSALAASFFGVAGTLIGAAVGSIVSTIAGALYADYLGRAGARIKVTKDVVIQRIPGEVLATTPLRHLTGPTDLPGPASMRPVGSESSDETVTVPVADATELLRRPEGMAPLDQTSLMPAVGSTAAQNALRSTRAPGRNAASGGASNGAGPHRTGADRGRAPEPSRTGWKKPVIAMGAVSAAGFLIALGVVLVTEAAIGHPVSGGNSGTTITRIVNSDTTSKTEVTPTEKPTQTPDATATSTPSASATTAAPVAPTAPSTTDGTDPAPTGQPTPDETDPGAAPSEPAPEGAVQGTDAP